MLSFIKKVFSSVFLGESGPVSDQDEEEIINCILHTNTETMPIQENEILEEKLLGQSDTTVQFDVETFKCVHKTGKVTHLCEEYGLIDNVFYFKPSQVSVGLVVKQHDEVLYSAYKARENEMDRVFKVYAIKGDSWGESLPESADEQNLKEISALSRVITGRVTQKRGREVYIESADIWCNLDNIQSSYIPFEGDWVELQAVVSICLDSANLSGEVLVVKSLKPLLTKSGFGRVTLWSDTKKEGAIENNIYFTRISCEDGYIPELGDEVIYDAIESDQGRFRWRATKVLINSDKFQDKTMTQNKCNNTSENSSNDIFCDKNDISITPSVCSVLVQLNEKKFMVLNVTNKGTVEQSIKRAKFRPRKNSQVMLLKPKSKNVIITPGCTVKYRFQVEGRSLGLFGKIFYFYFEDFIIAKKFEINVVSNLEMNKFLKCDFDTVFEDYKKRNFTNKNIKADLVLYGPRPWKPPKFISMERRCVYNIPKKLWSLFTERSQYMDQLMEYAPYLKGDLNFGQYDERFHTLLYLEEIHFKLDFRRYDMNGIFLHRSEDYLVLKIPDLVEKKHSLFLGVKVILTQPWSKDGNIQHVGYIHAVRANEIFLKFHSSFHETYDYSECDIVFEACSPIFFPRSHDAINRAVKKLGEQFLFPSAVNEKSPLIDLDLSEEKEIIIENANDIFQQIPKDQTKPRQRPSSPIAVEVESTMKNELNASKEILSKKKLIWINKNLNERQKLAIVNALQGKGRPLPYIIFGPPGTGKTVTLVELIIQIYQLMPESRILVATPSNSSADLICDRLIEAGGFKPGQLVRPVAFYRVLEGLVPENLIPYSTVYISLHLNYLAYLQLLTIASVKEVLSAENNFQKHLITAQKYSNALDSSGKTQFESYIKSNIRVTSLNEFTGRHRITVGTCVTVGALHYAGLPAGHFTHVLMDEAGQTSEPEALISATFQNFQNGQIVLTGDPQQLGPVIFSQVARKFGLSESLLQRLIGTFPYTRDFDSFPSTSGFDPRFITKLIFNYRSVPEILSLPSQMFYNADLVPTVSQTDSKEAEIIKKFNFETENRETPPALIFHGIIGQNLRERDSPSWFNAHEIWQVVFYMKKLYSLGLKSDDIGIITPYAKQVKKIKSLLTSLKMAAPKVGSVEEFQGQERYVIILSTVRSCRKYVTTDILNCLGFVANPQRLNVALTRARALLIIVGNPDILSKDPYWTNVINYCLKNNSYTGCSLDGMKKNIEVDDVSSSETDE